MSNRDVAVVIGEILHSVDKIQSYVAGLDFYAFDQDGRTQDAVVRNFEIIGEACRSIPASLRKQHSNIPWQAVQAMRNRLIHEYWSMSIPIVWKAIQSDLPLFKETLIRMRDEINAKQPKQPIREKE